MWSFGVFIPATTANDLRLRRIFYPRFYPLHLFSVLNSWERAIIFPFEGSVLNNGNTGTIFITSLVWRGPWLRIEPGTSRTRNQHYTTRLSRRWDELRLAFVDRKLLLAGLLMLRFDCIHTHNKHQLFINCVCISSLGFIFVFSAQNDDTETCREIVWQCSL